MSSDWRDYAQCRNMDPNLFLSNKGVSVDPRAKEACGDCVVRPTCLQWAVANYERGYWGGTTERQRRRLRLSKNTKLRITLRTDAASDIPTEHKPGSSAVQYWF